MNSVKSITEVNETSEYATTIFRAGPHIACNATTVYVCYERVCPSVRPSVKFWCFVEMNKATIMRFPPSDNKIILVSGEVKIVRKFAGDHP